MLDTIHSEPNDTLNACIVCSVRGDREPVSVCLVYDCGQFIVRELKCVVACHDFDEVGTSLHLLADRSSHLVRPTCFSADPVCMATRLDDCSSANLQSGTGKDSLLDGLLRIEVHIMEAKIPDHCHASS